jgi:hypothetical protein
MWTVHNRLVAGSNPARPTFSHQRPDVYLIVLKANKLPRESSLGFYINSIG